MCHLLIHRDPETWAALSAEQRAAVRVPDARYAAVEMRELDDVAKVVGALFRGFLQRVSWLRRGGGGRNLQPHGCS